MESSTFDLISRSLKNHPIPACGGPTFKRIPRSYPAACFAGQARPSSSHHHPPGLPPRVEGEAAGKWCVYVYPIDACLGVGQIFSDLFFFFPETTRRGLRANSNRRMPIFPCRSSGGLLGMLEWFSIDEWFATPCYCGVGLVGAGWIWFNLNGQCSQQWCRFCMRCVCTIIKV